MAACDHVFKLFFKETTILVGGLVAASGDGFIEFGGGPGSSTELDWNPMATNVVEVTTGGGVGQGVNVRVEAGAGSDCLDIVCQPRFLKRDECCLTNVWKEGRRGTSS